MHNADTESGGHGSDDNAIQVVVLGQPQFRECSRLELHIRFPHDVPSILKLSFESRRSSSDRGLSAKRSVGYRRSVECFLRSLEEEARAT